MFAAVTGASGHLGSNLVRILLARGYRVRVLTHNSYKAIENLQVEKVQGDILDIESLKRCFHEVNVVFHLAALISVVSWDRRSVEAVNIQGVHNVIQASKEMGISGLVHVSSFHAHLQKPLEEKLDENRPLIESYNHPPYNYSKAMGEKIVLNAMKEGLKAIIMTPAGMIGQYDYQPSHFGTTIVNMAKQKMPFIVNAGLNWVDTRDVSEAILRAVDRRRFGEKYIVSGHWQSLKTVASQISSFMENKSSQIIFPLYFAKNIAYLIEPFNKIRQKRPLFTPIALKELESNPYLDYSKASKELDYLPRPFSTTIVDTLKWFISAGYI